MDCDSGPEGGHAMPEELTHLIELAKRVEVSAEDEEKQRRSFAYGNTAFENHLITREMIDEEAEKLAREKNEPGHERK
jgi:hypothetical protein